MSELVEKEAVREFIKSYRHSTDVAFHMEDHLDVIPTIEAVPVVHGKWNPGKILSHEFVGNVCVSIDFEDWRCSICGIVVEQPNMPLYKYCPNCGAKMEVQLPKRGERTINPYESTWAIENGYI